MSRSNEQSGNQPVTIRQLDAGDLEQLFALRQISFLDRSDFSNLDVRARHAARLPYTHGHFWGDKLTSAAVCYPFAMFLAGRRVRVGGLASVLSAPETRRRGFVRALLGDILEKLQGGGVGWALEYPFDPGFYARYGFASVPTGSEVTFPVETLFSGPAPAAERFYGDAVEAAKVLEPIYDVWARGYSFTLTRDTTARPTWERILRTGNRFCYLLAEAYAVMELEQTGKTQTLIVHDYAFTTPAGRTELFRFLGSFYGQAELISLQLPSDEPLAFDLQARHTNELPGLQARIVDLQAALEPLPCPTEKEFTLQVTDPFCTWNDGVWNVTLAPTGSALTPSRKPPALSLDMSLDIGTLAQLLCGALSGAAALRAGRAEGDPGVAAALASLAGNHTSFMPSSDYF